MINVYCQYEINICGTRQVCYGRLEEIVVCSLSTIDFWGPALQGQKRLLAHITPCATNGKDATSEVTSYHAMTTSIITDLRTISAVVGRIQTRGRWAIVDRSEQLARTVFVDGGESDLEADVI